MCQTTRAIFGSNAVIRRVFPPCPRAITGKTVRFIIFDPKKQIDSRSDLKAAINQVGSFYNNLKNTSGLSNAIKADLASYNFVVEYRPSAPDDSTLLNLGRMDFPVYLFNTPGISATSTSISEIQQLMQRHQISAMSFLRAFNTIHPELPILAPVVDNYKTIESSWENRDVLGFGFPGGYYNNGSCGKLGIIKIDALLTITSTFDTDSERLTWVLQHELGHMFALVHHDDSLMNDKYDRHFAAFLPLQIGHVRDTLKRVSP